MELTQILQMTGSGPQRHETGSWTVCQQRKQLKTWWHHKQAVDRFIFIVGVQCERFENKNKLEIVAEIAPEAKLVLASNGADAAEDWDELFEPFTPRAPAPAPAPPGNGCTGAFRRSLRRGGRGGATGT